MFVNNFLLAQVPATLAQSDVVRKMPMKNLDLVRVSKAKLSLKGYSLLGGGGALKRSIAYGGQVGCIFSPFGGIT